MGLLFPEKNADLYIVFTKHLEFYVLFIETIVGNSCYADECEDKADTTITVFLI
jgi:hypothetical protein